VIYLALPELPYIAERAMGAEDEAYQLAVDVAAGCLHSVGGIAARLRTATEARPPQGARPSVRGRGSHLAADAHQPLATGVGTWIEA
jgi:hypothetical protein